VFYETAKENTTGCKTFAGIFSICTDSVSVSISKPNVFNNTRPRVPHDVDLTSFIPIAIDPGKNNIITATIFSPSSLSDGIISQDERAGKRKGKNISAANERGAIEEENIYREMKKKRKKRRKKRKNKNKKKKWRRRKL
jgi:hypothetical protein